MDEKELGKKIQKERKKRSISQEKVEKSLSLAEKAMTRIESGDRIPSTLELAKLAELFHMPIGDFFIEDSFNEDPLIALHRMAPGLEQDSYVSQEVDRCIYLCREGVSLERLLDQPLRQRIIFSSMKPPANALEAIRQGEQASKEERKRLGLSSYPLYDIVELLTSQGIWCAATHLPDKMSGLFLYKESVGMVILANASHGNARQRFSYAHEYAHALFDSDHQILISEAKNASELLEKRANAFAAAFLMPEDGIAEVMVFLNKGQPSRSSFSVYDVSTQGVIESEERQIAKNQKLSPQDIAFIANRFGSSYQAVVYRLQSLGYLSQREREELLEDENRGRDYLKLLGLEESVGDHGSLQKELRTYISHLVIEAYRQEKISRGRVFELSKLLNLPAQELIDLAATEND